MTALSPSRLHHRNAERPYPGWIKCTLAIGLPGMLWALIFAAA